MSGTGSADGDVFDHYGTPWRSERVTASDAAGSLQIVASTLTAEPERRTLGGLAIRYGKPGRTSAGVLSVKPGALKFPDDLGRVKLTKEHSRDESRGHLVALADTPEGVRATLKVSDGPEGDDALREAQDRTRDGFSFDVVDAVITNGVIVSASVIAIGQVAIPAFDDTRIDTVAAAATPPATPGEVTTTEGNSMTEEQIARLAALRALETLTQEEGAELVALSLLEEEQGDDAPPAADATAASATASVPAAPAPAASVPAVPAGHAVTAAARDTTSPYQAMLNRALDGWQSTGNLGRAITAALEDITNTDHVDDIEQPAWSGELWSGVQYEPVYSDLYNTGDLTSWKGTGWRFVDKLAMQDYTGDKADIPSSSVTTESSEYEAARLAVGVDIDRKFYDFPNVEFLNSLFRQIAESWTEQLDAKVKAYTTTNAVSATRKVVVTTANGDATVEAANGSFTPADVGRKIVATGIPAAVTILSVTDSGTIELSANATAAGTVTATIDAASTSLLKAVGRLVQGGRATKLGTLTGVVVNDDDLFDLIDVTNDDVPRWLALWNIDPANFRTDSTLPRGAVYGVVKPAATLRTLSGSPIRVNAQNIAQGGVDEAAFGYWAIEKHHPGGVLRAGYTPAID